MAIIAPLKGIRYKEDKVGDMSKVVAPPYDVVSLQEQEAFHQSHPNNVMNIDLGATKPEDAHPFDWHVRAAYEFNRWLAEGILVRDEKPAFYFTETEFVDPHSGAKKIRHGLICLLRLEEFGADAKVRPHERTFSFHTAERLDHVQHVQANLSQVFAVYPDEQKVTLPLLESGRKGKATYDFVDPKGHGQRMWPVYDKDLIGALGRLMEEKTIYIADGHHRYETALRYRRQMAQRGVQIGHDSPLNYLMVYLCAISDPGLAILPAHRLLKRTLNGSWTDMEAKLSQYFEVTPLSFGPGEETQARQAFLRQLKEEGRTGNVIGLYTKLASTYYLLKKRSGLNHSNSLAHWPDLLQKLDTVVLTSLLFQDVFGMTEEDLDDATRIAYSSSSNEAIKQVDLGAVDLAALHNPTRMEQVQNVAEAGLTMPRKSTYFFPKVITGLVFNPLNPFEEIVAAV